MFIFYNFYVFMGNFMFMFLAFYSFILFEKYFYLTFVPLLSPSQVGFSNKWNTEFFRIQIQLCLQYIFFLSTQSCIIFPFICCSIDNFVVDSKIILMFQPPPSLPVMLITPLVMLTCLCQWIQSLLWSPILVVNRLIN